MYRRMLALGLAAFDAARSGRPFRWRMLFLVTIITSVMVVIMDYDRPNDGFVQINQSSLRGVIADMKADLER